jgi:hypothetical protein
MCAINVVTIVVCQGFTVHSPESMKYVGKWAGVQCSSAFKYIPFNFFIRNGMH